MARLNLEIDARLYKRFKAASMVEHDGKRNLVSHDLRRIISAFVDQREGTKLDEMCSLIDERASHVGTREGSIWKAKR